MILRSFLVFGLLSLLYCGLVSWLMRAGALPSTAATALGANLMHEQDYIYHQQATQGSRGPRVVIVGSSIGTTFLPLPKDYFNLSINAGSCFTGLEIIRRTRHRPEVVVIETNVLLREADQEQIDDLFRPGVYQMREAVAALEYKNQPSNLMLRYMADRKYRVTEQPAAVASSAATGPRPPEAEPDKLMKQLLANRKAELTDRLPEAVIAGRLELLHHYVDELQKEGVVAVLLEAPESWRMMEEPQKVQWREALFASFPPTVYHWVPAVDARDYESRDTVHMTFESAGRYTRKILDYIGQLPKM